MINRSISVAFSDVHSIKSAYSAGIEDRIYIRFAKTHLCDPGVNGIVLINQIAIRSEKTHEVARCKQPQYVMTLQMATCVDLLVKCYALLSVTMLDGTTTVKFSFTDFIASSDRQPLAKLSVSMATCA